MSSKTANEFLKVLFKYTLVIILVMYTKIIITEFIPTIKENRLVFLTPIEKQAFKYENQLVETEDGTYTKPIFEDEKLNDFIDEYLENHSCATLEYDVTTLDEAKVSIFLNCGTPKSIIYDHKNKREYSFDNLLVDKLKFLEVSHQLLNLKYPTFVTDDIDFERAVYHIKPNELIGYYETKDFGQANIRINNNEIKDLMTYEMHYDDAYENEKYTLDPSKKTIAFTFDDGPSTYDLSLIDALLASHSTATFYMVGNRMQTFPTVISKMLEANMEVGNHTYDHKSLTSLTDAEVKDQITKTNEIFHEMTDRNLTSLRPSYGNVNKRVRLQVGLPVILWSIDTLDWKSRNADKVYDIIINEAKDGDIILMHSLYASTVDAVKKAIPELYKRGFQITSVGELAKLKGTTLDSSSVIWSIK